MDWTFLYGWNGYYFLQGFWLDIKSLIANASPIALIICFVVSIALLLLIERKKLRISSIIFAVFASLYLTFLLAVTLFGRTTGSISSWDQLFLTYERALFGEESSRLDILYNIVLYVPVGLFMSRYKNTKINIVILALMPIVIELLQLVTTRGMFELSDIINNFIGGLIGLGIARSIAKLIKYIKGIRKGGRFERAQ